MSSERKRVRNPVADIARALAALLLIAGHALAFAALPEHWLAGLSHLATPVFFFLSGVFISMRLPLREWLRTRMEALLKPYVVVLLGWAVVHAITGKLDWPSYLAGMLYGTGSTITILPLWFLPHLLLALCCTQLLLRVARRWQIDEHWYWWLVILLPFVASPVLQSSAPVGGLPWSADLLLLSLPLVLAGHLLADRVRHFMPSIPLCLLAVVAVWLGTQYGGGAIDMNQRLWQSPLAAILMTAAGVYVVMCLAAWLSGTGKVSAALAWFGHHTLLVLLFHFLWLRVLFRVCREQGVVVSEAWLVLVWVACVLLCCMTIVLVQHSRLLSRCLLLSFHEQGPR